MPIGTSVTHPLRIDEVVVPKTGGRIGMTILPGRSSAHVTNSGITWKRDLATDVEALRAAAPDLVFTLNESFEFANLGVPEFEATMRSSGIPWRHLPIPDAGVPDPAFERRWQTVGPEARAILKRGGLIVVHCRAGLGRTGTIAARLLVELGTSPAEAIAAVRRARAHTIETSGQERHIASIGPIAE